MITFFGFLVLLAGLAAVVFARLDKEGKAPALLSGIRKRYGHILIIAGVSLMLMQYLFFFADRGFNYLLVSPTGRMSAVMEQGIKWRGFAKIDKWQKYIDVKVVSKETESDVDELEGVMSPVPIRFIDQVTANGHVSLRFQLPQDKHSFINLAVKYRTMSNLVNNTIIPTVREQLINTGYMFAAQNYISGEAQSFRQTFEEQLKDGTYAVNKLEVRDTIFNEIDMTDKQRTIKEIETSYRVEKILEGGIPKRIPHELSENNIIVSQVIVDKIDLEATFKQRLEAQRDESAKRQLEQQKIETAKAEQQRIVAQGERDKAAERVTQEKEQVKALIAIETKLKQEETNKKLAAIALETERLSAQTVKVKADADAYEIAKKVNAGITPEIKLKMELDRDIKVAAEIAKIKFPETMIIADGENGTPLESLIGAAMAKQLQSSKK
ncbi:SPFH domain-containing protein [uncultured Draconibacterium sp.]|uniref:SPFH domain-containing protein n=1 Tax=uncultured Draconibacterium sp. TaxID=1573823 RepID=UPI0029C7357C|nr:SPFH domain-containing protein [uncultured Draconibacterium sp.]